MNNEYKRIYRSQSNRTLCGICGGIGEYLGIDPAVVRLIWVVASLGTVGMGVLIYFIAALVIPERGA